VRAPIVLFEPQQKYQKMIHHLLISKDYDVEVIEDLKMFLSLKNQQPLLFLVSDTRDPKITAEIKKKYPKVPMIALVDEDTHTLPKNYDAYITKPFIPSEFMLMIHQLTEIQEKETQEL